ncbi:hypothetical protein [Algoriphagus boritolerans]|uniref:DUF5675 domain-containing protein n=2 Tax=Algoriphagus TaxID=246875 RepID=A0A1H5XW10_9BACT|nr:hypothetical protein [Algoriphagus boritolerans]SEG15881.1 hypothetical protein SAMN03080598_02712 [Algoriphagus boritolerans DSM 17298 = JCM 18970]
MRLLLKRRYTPRGTPGRLFLGTRQLCFIREAPKSCFNPDSCCLEEGVYELEPVHTEEEGWRIRVGKSGWIRSKSGDRNPEAGELCPVTEYRADGTPLFTRLAFLKLMDELGPIWERGEVVELQIMSVGVPYVLESCRVPSYS